MQKEKKCLTASRSLCQRCWQGLTRQCYRKGVQKGCSLRAGWVRGHSDVLQRRDHDCQLGRPRYSRKAQGQKFGPVHRRWHDNQYDHGCSFDCPPQHQWQVLDHDADGQVPHLGPPDDAFLGLVHHRLCELRVRHLLRSQDFGQCAECLRRFFAGSFWWPQVRNYRWDFP